MLSVLSRSRFKLHFSSSTRPVQTRSSFEKLLKNLNETDSKALDLVLNHLHRESACANNLQSLRRASACHQWKHKIFNQQKLVPYYALLAVKLQRMSRIQFATIMTYWSIRQYHLLDELQIVPLFNEVGELTSLAKQTLQATANSFWNLENNFFDSNHTKNFIREMKIQPLSEQCFFIVPNLQPLIQDIYDRNDYASISISQAILLSARYNLFGFIPSSHLEKDAEIKANYRMIPSVGMVQANLRAYFGRDAVKINLILGLGTLTDIENNGLDHTREFSLPFPPITLHKNLPNKIHFSGISYRALADGFNSPQHYDFMHHDGYHAFVCSFIPHLHQQAFILIAQIVKKIIDENSLIYSSHDNMTLLYRCSKKFYLILIDMEFSLYREHAKFPKENNFILSLISSITMAAKIELAYNDYHSVSSKPIWRQRMTEQLIRNTQLKKEEFDQLIPEINFYQMLKITSKL